MLSRFVRETVAESSIAAGGVAKVEWENFYSFNTMHVQLSVVCLQCSVCSIDITWGMIPYLWRSLWRELKILCGLEGTYRQMKVMIRFLASSFDVGREYILTRKILLFKGFDVIKFCIFRQLKQWMLNLFCSLKLITLSHVVHTLYIFEKLLKVVTPNRLRWTLLVLVLHLD